MRQGAFHRLFNVLLPADHPSHSTWGVPERFTPLRVPDPLLAANTPLSHGTYQSHTVKRISANLELSGNQIVAPTGGVKFSCSSTQGAALVLLDRASRQDVHRLTLFKRYITENYRAWLDFANEVHFLGIKLSDFIFVTGCDRTTRWAMAAFSNPQTEVGANVGVEVPGVVSATFSLDIGWQTDVFVHNHWGPQPPIDSPDAYGNHRSLGSGSPDSPNDLYNQCVFIRGYRAKQRPFLAPKIIRAEAGPHDLGSGDRNNTEQNRVLSDDNQLGDDENNEIDLERIPDVYEDANLLSPLLDYMLDQSDAEVAIAHDEDIFPYIEEAGNLEGVPSLLARRQPGILVKDGVAMIQQALVESNSEIASDSVASGTTNQKSSKRKHTSAKDSVDDLDNSSAKFVSPSERKEYSRGQDETSIQHSRSMASTAPRDRDVSASDSKTRAMPPMPMGPRRPYAPARAATETPADVFDAWQSKILGQSSMTAPSIPSKVQSQIKDAAKLSEGSQQAIVSRAIKESGSGRETESAHMSLSGGDK